VNEVRLFKALAHQTRLRILTLLAVRPLCVCHLEAALRLSQVAASRHLSVLRAAGLVESRREGLWVHYRLAQPRSPGERMIFEWLRAHARSDKSLQEDVARMRECVALPLEEVVQIARG